MMLLDLDFGRPRSTFKVFHHATNSHGTPPPGSPVRDHMHPTDHPHPSLETEAHWTDFWTAIRTLHSSHQHRRCLPYRSPHPSGPSDMDPQRTEALLELANEKERERERDQSRADRLEMKIWRQETRLDREEECYLYWEEVERGEREWERELGREEVEMERMAVGRFKERWKSGKSRLRN
ncbi:hypothetical protein P7C73_g2487, partial [Tremellales sp. Uapishka_1]